MYAIGILGEIIIANVPERSQAGGSSPTKGRMGSAFESS